ncbi:MAG: carbamoyltransferase N-terminal domain-containing protein, partial [Pirellulales bacterium]
MYILGINAYHGGASACLIEDGKLIAAVEEERFSRIKYQAGFPTQAIQFVLAEAGIGAQELAHVGISRNPSANLLQKALFAFQRRPSLKFVTDRLQNTAKVGDLKSVFCEQLGLKASEIKAQFHNVEHHRAHMASAFLVSPFEEAAILSVDGMGDFVSTMWGVGKGNKMEVLDEVNFPHSLGIFYTAITQWLGFPKYGDEGKVMGLAPYGEPVYLVQMRKIVRVSPDGCFELDLDYFVHHAEGVTMSWNEAEPKLGMLFSDKMVKVLGEPRQPRSEYTKQHHDVAASLQAMLEDAEFALVRKLE